MTQAEALMALDMTVGEALRVAAEAAVDGEGELVETRMFGGSCFMFRGNMLCGAMGEAMGGGLMFRVGPEREAEALGLPGVAPMQVGARRMTGSVMVAPDAAERLALVAWLMDLALEHCCSLPPK